MTIVFASTNPGKLIECREIMSEFPFEIVSPEEVGLGDLEVAETGTTFKDNARLKAEAFSQASGLPAIGEDSGLEVAALDGSPGLYSKRYASSDQARIAKLLEEMVNKPDRTARFVAAVCFINPGESELETEAYVEGTITKEPMGTEGFGYDPVFIPKGGDGRSFAQMTRPEKAQFSHRGQALRQLATKLSQIFPVDKSLA